MSIIPILPEFIIIATAFLVLFLDLFRSPEKKCLLIHTALLGIFIALLALIFKLPITGNSQVFGGQFIMDNVRCWFKIIFLLAGFLTILISSDLLEGQFKKGKTDRLIGNSGEYLMVILMNLTGMMFLISSTNLVSLYVSLELATIPLFILVAWRKNNPSSSSAGMKYIILGAVSSGLLLYGLSLLFGLSGSMQLSEIGAHLQFTPIVFLATSFILAGVGFKLTLVPYHMWAADVYQGAPVPVTAYLSVASKAAGVAFAVQLFFQIFGHILSNFAPLFALLAAITMTVGNLAAVVQKNIKRFMAFSAISQAGYILLAFLGPSQDSIAVILFYMIVYTVSNMAVFAVITLYKNETGRDQISEYRGLAQTNPVIALVMMLGLFSLAGIPPLSGFVGKFFLFNVAAEAGYHWLVGFAAVNSTISLYYYLRIVRQMYIEPVHENVVRIRVSNSMKLALMLTVISLSILGIIPHLYELIASQTAGWLETLGVFVKR